MLVFCFCHLHYVHTASPQSPLMPLPNLNLAVLRRCSRPQKLGHSHVEVGVLQLDVRDGVNLESVGSQVVREEVPSRAEGKLGKLVVFPCLPSPPPVPRHPSSVRALSAIFGVASHLDVHVVCARDGGRALSRAPVLCPMGIGTKPMAASARRSRQRRRPRASASRRDAVLRARPPRPRRPRCSHSAPIAATARVH